MHLPLLLLAFLLVSSSVTAAHSNNKHTRSSTHARHRRLSNANKEPLSPADQALPAAVDGTAKTGRRSKERCKLKMRPTVSTSVAEAKASVGLENALIGGSIWGGIGPVVTATVSTVPAAFSANAPPAGVSSNSSSSSTAPADWTPNGKKAGIAGGDSYSWMEPHIGSWYDWSATPPQKGTPLAISMLWGGGSADDTDAARLAAFKAITSPPKFILGFEEPDCTAGSGSAGMDVASAAELWNSLVVPFGEKGSVLFSPSMCKQADETWLTPFKAKISRDWDITSIHVNKNSMAGVQKDLDYYHTTYNKPISVSEFACVDDSNGFTPCTDQAEIDRYINEIVPLFEADPRVVSYYYSDGYGLGNVWPTVRDGKLSASGQTYLDAISKYH